MIIPSIIYNDNAIQNAYNESLRHFLSIQLRR